MIAIVTASAPSPGAGSSQVRAPHPAFRLRRAAAVVVVNYRGVRRLALEEANSRQGPGKSVLNAVPISLGWTASSSGGVGRPKTKRPTASGEPRTVQVSVAG